MNTYNNNFNNNNTDNNNPVLDFNTLGQQFAQSVGGKFVQAIGDKFIIELPNGKTVMVVPQEAIDEIGDRYCVKQVTDILIKPTEWIPLLGPGPEGARYKCDIRIPECREDMMPDVMVTKDCTSLVNTVCESFNGYVTIYSETIPLADIKIPRIDLWKEQPQVRSFNNFDSEHASEFNKIINENKSNDKKIIL